MVYLLHGKLHSVHTLLHKLKISYMNVFCNDFLLSFILRVELARLLLIKLTKCKHHSYLILINNDNNYNHNFLQTNYNENMKTFHNHNDNESIIQHFTNTMIMKT